MYSPYYGTFRIISGNRSVLDSCCTYPVDRTTEGDLTLHPYLSDSDNILKWVINTTYKTKSGEFLGVPVSFKTEAGEDAFVLTALTSGDYYLHINEDGNLVVQMYKKNELYASCVLEKISTTE